MIKIPYEKIIEIIKEKANISEEEIEERINKKLKQLFGLISKEGAGHIVANEFGVKLFEPLSGKLQIKNILSGMRDVETVGKVLEVYSVKMFDSEKGSGKVGSILIGDETDAIRVVMWGSQSDIISNIENGDVVKIIGGYVRDNRGRREVHLNDKSKVLINPEGEAVNNVIEKNRRKNIRELNENDADIELLGTIVQIFEPRFFDVCSQCGRKVRISDDSYVCSKHDKTTAVDAYVVNAVIDDGAETIRAVFFRGIADKLFNTTSEEFLRFKNNIEGFNKVKENILGTMIKASGRAVKNAMFERLEFIANSVEVANPEEELQRLQRLESEKL